MKVWTKIGGILAAVAFSVAAAPASASFAFAPTSEVAVFNFGGSGETSPFTISAGGLSPSTLVFNLTDPATGGTREFEALNGQSASAPSNFTLETGAGNNGVWFAIDYQRFLGMAAPNAPAGTEMGVLQIAITSTLTAGVTTLGPLQSFTVSGELEITDLNGFYNTPTAGTFRLTGTSTTSIAGFGFSLQIEVPGEDSVPMVTSEPALLALVGGGLLAVGVARTRRRRA